MEAILLVGGQGTRLRPLTLTTPKPMLPLAGIPFITHQLSRCRDAGIDHVVLATSYKSEIFTDHFGDGDKLGLTVTYAVESEPLGTGGALRNAAMYLRESTPTLVLNGDVLGGLDLLGLLRHHQRVGADITLHLREVPDPAAYGVVTTRADGRVTDFAEKSAEPTGNQVNAGTYVFSRPVLLAIPPGRVVSLERETFPGVLRGHGHVEGVRDQSYWLDIGTPDSYVQGNCDLVQGRAPSAAARTPVWDRLILGGAQVAATAELTGGTVVGHGAHIGVGAQVCRSVIFDEASVGEGAQVRDSVIGRGARIGAGTVVTGVLVEDGAQVLAEARVGGLPAS